MARPGNNVDKPADDGVVHTPVANQPDRGVLTLRRLGLILLCAVGLAVALRGNLADPSGMLAVLRSTSAQFDLGTLLTMGFIYAIALALLLRNALVFSSKPPFDLARSAPHRAHQFAAPGSIGSIESIGSF